MTKIRLETPTVLANGILQTDNPIDGTLQTVKDQNGNSSELQIANNDTKVTGTLTVADTLTAEERINLEADSTATTQTTAVIQATDTDSGIAIVPNGIGAITVQVPDGTAAGGDARGDYAVDLQRVRSLNTQVATGSRSIILNGERNRTTGVNSIVGGYENFTSGLNSVALGFGNSASGLSSFAVNNSNSVSRNHGFVAGSSNNIQSTGDSSSITGGNQNVVQTDKAHIGGGLSNSINYTGTNGYEVISGGRSNTASISYATISGGQSNTASTNTHATVVGGYQNSSTGQYSVSGGYSNVASNTGAVALGYDNTASNVYSVAIGLQNTASGNGSVAFGSNNNSSGQRTVAIGEQNTVSGGINVALGCYNSSTQNQSTIGTSISLGYSNSASRQYSIATGSQSSGYIDGQFSNSSGQFSAKGDAQQSTLVRRIQDTLTTGATTTVASDLIPNGNNRVWNVTIKYTAVVTNITGTATGVSVGDCKNEVLTIGFKKIGGISQNVGAINILSTNEDASMNSAVFGISAGPSQEMKLDFSAPIFIGGGSLTIRVVAKVELTEVAY